MEDKKTWITETGTVLVALGGGLLAVGPLMPPMSPYGLYATVGGTLLSSVGAALIGLRISKKLKS